MIAALAYITNHLLRHPFNSSSIVRDRMGKEHPCSSIAAHQHWLAWSSTDIPEKRAVRFFARVGKRFQNMLHPEVCLWTPFRQTHFHDCKAKGKGKGTTKQDTAVKFEGYCSNSNCGKWGHRWTDCWKGGGGGAHGKSKDEGKGKSKDKHGKNKGEGKSANSMESRENWNEPQKQDLQQQPAQQTTAAGPLGLCSDGSSYSVPHRHQEEQREQIDVTMGSGSAVSAFPENVGEVFGFAAPASGLKYVTPDGHANVQDHGRRTLKVVTEVATPVNMDMRVECTRQWCQQGTSRTKVTWLP